MKIKKYMILSPLLYKLVMFAILPILYLGIIVYTNRWDFKAVFQINIYSLLIIVEIRMDQYLFQGIGHKKQMELLKTAYHGESLISDGLLIDKIRRFIELYLLTSLSHYTGFIEINDNTVPLLFIYLLEALLQYTIIEAILIPARQVGIPIMLYVYGFVGYLISIMLQISLLGIVEVHAEAICLTVLLILAISVSVFSQHFMMKKIRFGKSDATK